MARLSLLLAALSAVAADWPRFRGPNGAGVTDSIPLKWSPTENVRWAVDLPGKGNGSPIIAGGRVYIQASAGDGSKRMLLALDAATGKTVWSVTQPGQPAKVHAKSSLASHTPACDGERVYCCVWDGDAVAVHAYDLAGKEVWSQSLGSFASQHGAGMSPVAHAGKVFVNFDQDGAAEVVAFDARTGAKAWGAPRKAYRACYSTPVVRELPGGKSELIVLSTAGVTGYDPDTGKPNWNWTIPWKGGEMALRSVASPLLVGDMVVALTGDGSGARYCAGVKAGGRSPEWEYRSNQDAPYVPCPVAKGDHLYWVTDRGIVQCLAVKTGKVVWDERAFSTGVSASPLLARDVFLAIDERGRAVACKASPDGFEKLAANDLREPVFATPAAADGHLYVRTAGKLYCFGK
jgi:outer membrane protein assembly factor BamB